MGAESAASHSKSPLVCRVAGCSFGPSTNCSSGKNGKIIVGMSSVAMVNHRCLQNSVCDQEQTSDHVLP